MKNALAILLASLCLFTACKKDPAPRVVDHTYNPDISVGKFTSPLNFTNPYFPLEAGKTYFFEATSPDGPEKAEVVRTEETKNIAGITCAVIHDLVWLNGTLIEDTYDYFAQDNSGNVWYFGEDVKNYNPDGSFLDTGGSWIAGVNGAKPGIIMLATPTKGMSYREEYLFNEAEDQAEVVGTGETITTAHGTYTNCIQTRNWTALESGVEEHKWYAPAIGLIKTTKTPDGDIDEFVKTTGGYEPDVTAAKFSNPTNITNQWSPFPDSKKYIYEQVTTDGTEHIEVSRIGNKVVMGINCVVIHDVVQLNNVKIEETWDWYAQDNDGNLWYFGEDVDNFDHATGAFIDHHGAWEAGVKGALPGIIMLANPKTGDQYHEEYLWGEAEDEAEVAETGLMNIVTPLQTFNNCIKTRNYTRLQLGDITYKIYAPSIGSVKEINADGEALVLVKIE